MKLSRVIKSIVLLLFLFSTTLIGQQLQNRFFYAYTYESLTIDNTVGGIPFTSSKVTDPNNPINSAELVTFTVNCASGTSCPIHFTIDGTTPTTTDGLLVDYGQFVTIYAHPNIVRFKGIRAGATSAVLNVTYNR